MRKDYNLEKRKYVIGGFIVVLVCIYVVRLFMLQIMDDSYKEKSDGNAHVSIPWTSATHSRLPDRNLTNASKK